MGKLTYSEIMLQSCFVHIKFSMDCSWI